MGARMATSRHANCVADVRAELGEGPVWVVREQALYWLDIKGRKIFRRDDSGAVAEWATPMRVGSLAPRSDGGFVAGTDRGFAHIDLETGSFVPFLNPETDRSTNRFNDGKVDRQGNFWAGTMDDQEKTASGALYRLGPDRSATRCDDHYRVTNGPAFSTSGTLMYHNDSALQQTYVFDLDAGGTPFNRRLLIDHSGRSGYPDGMTVDSEDCLWIAFWDGWCVRRFSAEGELIATHEVPVQRPTSCAFGGASLTDLFITSASIGLSNSERADQPCAGGLFMLDSGCAGVAEIPFAG